MKKSLNKFLGFIIFVFSTALLVVICKSSMFASNEISAVSEVLENSTDISDCCIDENKNVTRLTYSPEKRLMW